MQPDDSFVRLRENIGICLPEQGLADKLAIARRQNRRLIIKLGFDPTAPDLHLGHAVVLKKLRQFQDEGHTIVIIIGDFTARIGDPTGKNKSRPPLSAGQVALNARTYVSQLGKILNTSACQIRYNSEWLGRMGMTEAIHLLSQVTLAQVMQRTDFSNRFEQNIPVSLHELVYPLLQGQDSVMIDADIEMGGTDQLFNCAMGRQLQEHMGKPAQAVLCMPLLRGIDGSAKMSKSEGNTIGLTDTPEEMFGKIMSIPDALLPEYIQLTTSFSNPEKQALAERLSSGENPMLIKKLVGLDVVRQYHDQQAAEQAQAFFEKQFQSRNPDEKAFTQVSRSTLNLSDVTMLVDVCKELKTDLSKSQLRRLIEAGSVSVNGEKIVDPRHLIDLHDSPIKLKIGKRDFFELDA